MVDLLSCPFCGGKAELIEGGPGNAYVRCTVCATCGNDSLPNPAIMRWNRRAARSAPEAGKAVDFADGIPFELVEKVENRIAYRISLGSTPRAIAEDVLQLALASVPAPSGAEPWIDPDDCELEGN